MATATVLAVVALIGASSSPRPEDDPPAPDERRLEAHVEFLAHEELKGRAVGDDRLAVAAQYLASMLHQTGVKPWPHAGRSGGRGLDRYLQPFTLEEELVTADFTLDESVDSERPVPRFELNRDFRVSLPQALDVSHVLVTFVGFGIHDPARQYDDLAGAALDSRVALILNNPRSRIVTGDFFLDPAVHDRYFGLQGELARLKRLRSAGVRAVLAVRDPWRPSGEAAKEAESMKARRRVRASDAAPRDDVAREISGMPVVNVSNDVADALLRPSGHRLADLAQGLHTGHRPRSLSTNAGVSLRIRVDRRAVATANVLGYVGGSDPTVAGEPIVVGAHYDHLGQQGDIIWPGADDNGSGVAAVMEVARIVAASPRPRRGIIVAFWSAEEEGLLGSRHFVSSLAARGTRIAAALNLDMVGRAERRESGSRSPPVLHVVSTPRLRISELLARVPAHHGLELLTDRRTVTDIRSDNVTFASADIETIAIHHGWEHVDYHEPTDTPDKIDFSYLSAVTRLVASMVVSLAN